MVFSADPSSPCDPLQGEFLDKVSLIYCFALVEFPQLDCAFRYCIWQGRTKIHQ